MIIGPEFIFVHMPKTGGEFVIDWLTNCFELSYIHTHRHVPLQWCRLIEIRKKFVFGFIRDPFAWYVSWWAGQLDKSQPFDEFLKAKARSLLPSTWDDSSFYDRNDIGLMTYRFLTCFSDLTDVDLENDPISSLLTHDIYMMDQDMSIPEILNFIFEKHIGGLKDWQREYLFKMPPINTSEHDEVMSYYNQELIDLVLYKDKLIFECFPQYKNDL